MLPAALRASLALPTIRVFPNWMDARYTLSIPTFQVPLNLFFMFLKKTCLICPKVKTYLELISWRKILQYELRLILVGSYQNISQGRSRCSVLASPEREREKRNNGKLTVTVILNSLRTVDSGEQITVLSRYNTEVVQLLLNWKRTEFSFPRANMWAIPEAWSGLGWVTSSKIIQSGRTQ